MLTHAQLFGCQDSQDRSLLCDHELSPVRQKVSQQTLTAFLVSDAPLRLLLDTQHLWFQRMQQCKTLKCYQQQFDQHLDDLNFYISLNQTLTQHYLKYEQGKLAKSAVYLKVHQLAKDNIKIEGTAYRNPNNQLDKQVLNFLAYTTPAEKNAVINNETDCKYQFEYGKALLSVKSSQKGCERFNGIYRLYD